MIHQMKQGERITNRKLMNWNREIAIARQQDSIFARFFKGKIDEFYRNNKLRIESFNERYKRLESEYLATEQVIIEGGGTREQPVFEGEGKDRIRKMVDGKDRAEFEQKLEALFNEEIGVVI